MPELLWVLGLAAVTVLGVLWWDNAGAAAWRTAPGRAVEAEVRLVHYNAPDTLPRVRIAYEYFVDGVRYTGTWIGLWPAANSPNALPAERLTELERSGYPLTVYFDAHAPSVSRIHDTPYDLGRVYGGVFGVGVVLLVVYAVRVYPAWKRRQRYGED